MPSTADWRTEYHHSVRHYGTAAPLVLEHRNRTAFSGGRMLCAADRAAEAYRMEIENSFHSPGRLPPTRHQYARRNRAQAESAVLGTLPLVTDVYQAINASSSSQTTHAMESQFETESARDNYRAWLEHKQLSCGRHDRIRRKTPYVSRREYVDPIRGAVPGQTVPAGYVKVPSSGAKDPQLTPWDAPYMWVSIGRRFGAPAGNLPEKVTTCSPFSQWRDAELNHVITPEMNPPAAVRVARSPLLQEADERLRLSGMGSLLDIVHASDEAISAVLRDMGFSPTQRMTLLWELRRAEPRRR